MLESPRLTPFTLQLNQIIFYPLSLPDHKRSKCSFRDVVLHTWRTKARSHCEQASHHVVRLYP
jgi:hypothetical protein